MPKRKKRPTQGYDVPMIRDFLEHLQWEVRIVHAEATHLDGQTHPELMDQLEKLIERRGVPGLMEATALKKDAHDQETVQRAIQVFRRFRARQMKTFIDAFDALEPLFEEALQCAKSKECIVREWKVDDILELMGENGIKGDDGVTDDDP